MLFRVLLLATLALLALLVFFQLRLTLECLVAWDALEDGVSDCARVGFNHLGLLLLEHVFRDGTEIKDAPLGVVDVEFSRQVELVGDDAVELNVASCADDLLLALTSIDLLVDVHYFRLL